MSQKKDVYFRFRIIAGTLKGKTISAPNLGITRPPLTRLRKAIFDFLSPYLESSLYLDLFSGTGSYLFEAVSRGVESATGIEVEKKLAQSINRQAEKLNVQDRLRCRCGDVFNEFPRLALLGRQFDIVMIAPPQYVGLVDRTLRCFKDHRVLSRDAMIICQHDSSETGDIDFGGFRVEQHRKYGNTTFTILRCSDA